MNQFGPLITHGLPRYIVVVGYRFTDEVFKRPARSCQLDCNGTKELTSMAEVPPTSREKEVGHKSLLLSKSLCDSPSDGGFACTGHAIQPEDALVAWISAPFHDLASNIHTGVGTTVRLVVPFRGIKVGTNRIGKLRKAPILLS